MASVKVEYQEYQIPATCECYGDDWVCEWKVLVDGEEIASGDVTSSIYALEEAMKALVKHYGHTVEIEEKAYAYYQYGEEG